MNGIVTRVPSDHRRVRILKAIMYAREELQPGAVVIVPADDAQKWIARKLAEAVEAPEPGPQLYPTCPKCQAPLAIPATLEPGAPRWVQCPNPRCAFGWLR